ncbi:replication stress response regulator SDE2 isoform X2 [Epinephelus fuscoguttatus]|uniref:replication stress response regulator SDE2 isoform X2 n=1 Tax=Epinephelus fuscoguttatus TaxID=293821 RepID=UPI0020D0AC70|nr:replication stress response regulator SDE2 isoform X2 [Epinephelus fuscoguttatus]
MEESNMEVFVSSPSFRFSTWMFPDRCSVRDVLRRFVQQQGVSSSSDFYVIRNGRRSQLEDPLQQGAIYHLEPRLCGGKGGFGSMLRALGAQIEKTTNREACRDLSGRRLRDVNHEKEMAEWLKKQAEREAEKEQRRLERLQRKLSEPKHQFSDPEYQQQCHDLSERLEDSVIKGLQASSSSQVKVDDVSAAKRPNCDQSEQPHKKKRKTTASAAASVCFWTGLGEMLSSEDEDDDADDDEEGGESPSTSSSSYAAAVTMTTQTEKSEQSSSSSAASDRSSSATPGQSSAAPGQSSAAPGQSSAAPGQSSVAPGQSSVAPGQSSAAPGQSSVTPGQSSATPAEEQKPSEESSCCSQRKGQSPVDLSSVSSVAQLESLGLDVLKEELMSRGLKCGGTLTERAARLFSVRGLTRDQIDPTLLAKLAKTKRK